MFTEPLLRFRRLPGITWILYGAPGFCKAPYNRSMELNSDGPSKSVGHTDRLSQEEISELAIALRKLAEDGIAIPKNLIRSGRSGSSSAPILHGITLEAVPHALELLGLERDDVVVGLIRRFEQVVYDLPNDFKTKGNSELARYLDVVFLLDVVKPRTEKGAMGVCSFLRSEKDDVRRRAADMLHSTPYYPFVVERIFESVLTQGVNDWPYRHARTLASFSHVREVRQRLLDCMRSDNDKLRRAAVMTLSYMKESVGAETQSELYAIAANDNDALQSVALDALRNIAPESAKVRQLALRSIKSDKFWVRGHSIWCLAAFTDAECIDALISALSDEGGPDFSNAAEAAKLLEKMPLDADRVLGRLVDTLKTLLVREDELFAREGENQNAGKAFAAAVKAELNGTRDSNESMPDRFYADSEFTFLVARLLGKLGATARSAVPLVESCMARPYAARGRAEQDWREVLTAIRNT
jgi:hypothetical protein